VKDEFTYNIFIGGNAMILMMQNDALSLAPWAA
jgi:hypothetical protein